VASSPKAKTKSPLIGVQEGGRTRGGKRKAGWRDSKENKIQRRKVLWQNLNDRNLIRVVMEAKQVGG